MKKIPIIFFSFCFFLFSVSIALPERTSISAESHIRKADMYLKEGRDFLAVEEYRQAIRQGSNHPELFRNLAATLYLLGLVDDAIVEMEKAVELSSNTDFLIIMELGILYLAKDRIEKAKAQFFAVLEMNPGFADAYYFLGESFLKTKDYDMAWLFAKMAQRLGHKGQDLVRKLETLSKEPEIVPWNVTGKDVYIRQILVDTYEKAKSIVNRISGGELFEDIAVKEFTGPTANLGGFVGHFNPSEVHPKIAEALLEQEVLAAPVIVETEKGFHIVQRIVPFNFNSWKKLLSDSGESNLIPANNLQATTRGNRVTFIVHVGSFKNEKNAIERVRKLRDLGYPSYRFLKGTWYNVVAGRYNSLKEAMEVGKKIANQGYEYFISKY